MPNIVNRIDVVGDGDEASAQNSMSQSSAVSGPAHPVTLDLSPSMPEVLHETTTIDHVSTEADWFL